MKRVQVSLKRGEITESCHEVMAVIMDHQGKTLQSYFPSSQEQGFEVFPRSAIKFAQAISFVQSGAVEKFNLNEKHIAIACASHAAEKFHTDLVSEWLKQMDHSESLECGAHYPGDEASFHQMIRQGHKPTALHNNCSGKHAGMIATCLALGFEVKGYSDYNHPLQKRLRKILSSISDFNFDHARYGIDGCSIPTYPVSLSVIARMMSALLPQRRDHEYVQHSERIIQSVKKYPEYIAGTNGYCTKIIQATQGRILAKTGAEGVYVALDLSQGKIIALKAKDGQTRASRAALLSLLSENNWINQDELLALTSMGYPSVKNWSGQVVGQTKVDFLKENL